jgi:hypothetical protein
MISESFDPTAGARAREVQRNPGVPQPILDPTDPRYGQLQGGARASGEVLDATDPRATGRLARQRGGPGHVYPSSRRRREADEH